MSKEVLIELNEKEKLENFIEKVYFKEGFEGKILKNEYYLSIDKSNDKYSLMENLQNAVVKISESDLIDGTAKFIIDKKENEDKIRLYPTSIYAIKDNGKYVFY